MNLPVVPSSCRAFPSLSGACGELRRLARAGSPAAIDDLDQLDPAEALLLLDFFLHDPEATETIEPFASILSALHGKRPLGLWDLFPPAPGDGAEEAARERFLRVLPRDHQECMSCRCFPVCEGYAARARACETWKAVISGIAAAARELSRP